MKVQILGLFALAVGFTACNNDDKTATTTTTDSSTMTATDATANTSTVDYTAMADSVERNSQQGYYLNPKTGKAYTKLKVDRSTGRVSTEAGEPVWRYVDKRNWWVYGYDNNNWNQMGTAKMNGDKLMYQGQDDTTKWISYDERWKADDERMMSSMNDSGSMNSSDNMNSGSGSNELKVDDKGNKVKDDNLKVKTSKDGDVKLKDKQTGEKVKYDAQKDKIKQGH